MGRQKHIVASTSEIPPGSRKLVTINGRDIAIFNVGGEFFGILNRCPHKGGSLFHGHLTGFLSSAEPGSYCYERPGEILRCSWHGWEFDLRNGKSYCSPAVRAKIYPLEVEPGAKVVEGPYAATTVPISVEEDYVIVEA